MKNTSRFAMIIDVLKFCALSGLLVWLMARGTTHSGYHWQWYRVPQFVFTFRDGKFVAGPLLQGLGVTLRISGISLIFAMTFGMFAALFRLSHSFTARAVARVYLELIRNTPLLIQLFCIYFVIAPVLDMGAFSSAVLALSLFEGAYASEILRAGILSIHKGQWEAAYSLGISATDMYRYVILPQAFRRILPPLASQAISLIKDSALVSTIAIYDLTMRGQAIVAETFLTFEIWFTVAAIYLLLTVSLSFFIHWLEKTLHNGAAR